MTTTPAAGTLAEARGCVESLVRAIASTEARLPTARVERDRLQTRYNAAGAVAARALTEARDPACSTEARRAALEAYEHASGEIGTLGPNLERTRGTVLSLERRRGQLGRLLAGWRDRVAELEGQEAS
jgi:hypothetical protein